MISSRLAIEASGWLMISRDSSAWAAACSWPRPPSIRIRLGIFFLQALVAAGDHLAHRGEVVDTVDSLDDELAVVRLFHLAVFPDHHGGDRLRALDVRDIEAFNALGAVGKAKGVSQGFLDGAGVGLHHAEALV